MLIARALAGEPDLFFLDEPTAGVDLPSQQALADALGRAQGRAAPPIVLVAHELGPLAPLVDRAVVMRDGRVAYDGPPLADHEVHRRRRSASRTATTTTRPRPGTTTRRTSACAAGPARQSTDETCFTYDFMQRALLAALFTGLAAPAVGTYLVQRRLALMGDGIGHVAVTGVALGLLTGTSPTWTAVVVAVLGAVLIEVIRERGHTNGDVALALLFYGGLAGGVLLTGLGRAERRARCRATSSARSPRSRRPTCWVTIGARGRGRRRSASGWRPQLFAVAQDQEFARVAGLNVRAYNLLVAVLAAVTRHRGDAHRRPAAGLAR